MASGVPNPTKKKLVDGSIDLDGDTFKISLHTSSFAPNFDTLDFRDDLTNEVTATGYTAGGQTLAGLSIAVDLTNDRAEWTFTAPQWTITGSVTARYAVISKIRGGAASADEVVLVIDFGSDKTATDGTFTITPNAEGVLQIA